MTEARSLRVDARELLVIVLGVLIALAADRWMEGVRETRDEGLYLERIAVDLGVTVDAVEGELPRMQLALRASEVLSTPDAAHLAPDSLVALYLAAAQIGVSRGQLGSDVAFRELVSSGQLNILRNGNVRSGISEFYRGWESMVAALERLESVGEDVGELTGLRPYRLRGARAQFTTETKARIVAAAAGTADTRRLFRGLHADLDHRIARMTEIILDARELRSVLEQAGGGSV